MGRRLACREGYLLKKRRCRDQDSPQVTIERYLKRLLFMLPCFWAMEEPRRPLRGDQPPAPADPPQLRNRQGEQQTSGESHDGSHQLSGQGWLFSLSSSCMQRATVQSLPSYQPWCPCPTGSSAVSCFEPIVIGAGDKFGGSFAWA